MVQYDTFLWCHLSIHPVLPTPIHKVFIMQLFTLNLFPLCDEQKIKRETDILVHMYQNTFKILTDRHHVTKSHNMWF